MGYTEAADNYTHFTYEMVALTPRCAIELGYTISDEDRGKSYIEVSGRKGFGVKADDLLDQLIAAAKAEVDTRHPEIERRRTPHHRHANRRRRTPLLHAPLHPQHRHRLRLQRRPQLRRRDRPLRPVRHRPRRQHLPQGQHHRSRIPRRHRRPSTSRNLLDTEEGSSLWETWLLASKLTLLIEQCIATAEPAYLAKYAFQLAQQFNNFYHRHHVLNETDPTRKAFLLATAAVAQREMTRALGYLGIEAPPVM